MQRVLAGIAQNNFVVVGELEWIYILIRLALQLKKL